MRSQGKGGPLRKMITLMYLRAPHPSQGEGFDNARQDNLRNPHIAPKHPCSHPTASP